MFICVFPRSLNSKYEWIKDWLTKNENPTDITDLELFKQVLTASCYEQSSWQLYDTFDLEEKEGAKTFMGTLVEEEKLLAFYENMGLELLNSGHST